MPRKIAVVTGTRAEYGILRSVLRAVRAQRGLELKVIATGMHLSHEFGYTVDEIIKDGFDIAARVEMVPADDTPAAAARSVGQGITGMTDAFQKLQPDIIVVLGDRTEPLAAAVAGAYMNIPVAHIHGGDNPQSGLDENARHAITKMAHIHFPATKKSAERIIKMGEDEWRVHIVGSPALDEILNEALIEPETIARQYNIDLNHPLILIVQHPVSTEPEKAAGQVTQTLEAAAASGFQVIVVYPNSDAGGRSIITVINDYVNRFPIIKSYPSLPRREYLSLLKIARVMAGNSSSGIIDAPSFGLPVINIGTRQAGRERGGNIIDVDYNKGEILKAINRAVTDNKFRDRVKRGKNPYGDGRAGVRIAGILADTEITPPLLQKKITY